MMRAGASLTENRFFNNCGGKLFAKTGPILLDSNRAQLGIAALSSLVDISTANNTVAIVMAGPIAKDISNEFSISPKRTAAILDIFTSVWQGIIPYGAQILYACAGAAAVGMTLSPVELFPYLFYPILMGISAVVFILFFGNRKKSKK